MAAKQKHRAGHGAAGQLQHAHRSLEKGDFRQALKDAKVGYRRQPGPETRQLLEQAYLARGRQLYRAGLQVESRAVIESLLEIGPSEDSVRKELPELLVALGLFNRIAAVSGVDSSIEEGSPYYIAAVDHAVLRPDNAPPSLPAVRQGAKTIRQALSALEAGDEAEAMAALKDVARTSPLADWKYFVRGLAAYYRQDADEMPANWNRLDAGRFAARIAAALKFFADQDTVPTDDVRMADALARLNGGILGKPELAQLQTLQGYVAAGRWREMVKLLPAVNQSLRHIDPTMAQRLAADLYATVVLKGKPAVLRKLAMLIEPPPIDPHWNRGLAMAWELYGDDDCVADNELAQAERYWRAYLDDLAHLESLLPAERTLARALVYTRLGQMLAEMSGPMCSTCQVRHDPDEDVKARAVDCFEEALTLSPALLERISRAGRSVSRMGRDGQGGRHVAAIVRAFPREPGRTVVLGRLSHPARRAVCRPQIRRPRQRLKPLDTTDQGHGSRPPRDVGAAPCAGGGVGCGTSRVRRRAGIGRDASQDHKVLASRAALELKAGDSERANRLLDEAMNVLGEAAPVWLMMAIESRRYALSQVVVERFRASLVNQPEEEPPQRSHRRNVPDADRIPDDGRRLSRPRRSCGEARGLSRRPQADATVAGAGSSRCAALPDALRTRERTPQDGKKERLRKNRDVVGVPCVESPPQVSRQRVFSICRRGSGDAQRARQLQSRLGTRVLPTRPAVDTRRQRSGFRRRGKTRPGDASTCCATATHCRSAGRSPSCRRWSTKTRMTRSSTSRRSENSVLTKR